jgi:hypothetical protein
MNGFFHWIPPKNGVMVCRTVMKKMLDNTVEVFVTLATGIALPGLLFM